MITRISKSPILHKGYQCLKYFDELYRELRFSLSASHPLACVSALYTYSSLGVSLDSTHNCHTNNSD